MKTRTLPHVKSFVVENDGTPDTALLLDAVVEFFDANRDATLSSITYGNGDDGGWHEYLTVVYEGD